MLDYFALRQTLIAVLSDDLGTYTFADGSTTPAIFVGYGSGPDESTRVSGLECVVIARPDVPMTPLLGGFQEDYTAEIYLRAWDNDAQGMIVALFKALDALASQGDLNVGNPTRIMAFEQIGNIEEARFSVTKSVARAF